MQESTEEGSGLLSGLNERQREAVTAPDGPVLVIAGPGSGKTRVIVTRIAHLIEQGRARADEIAAITFTRKAADEMERRLAPLTRGRRSGRAWISTFHRLCVSLLREHGAASGIAADFGIADEGEQLSAMRKAMFDAEVDIRVWKPQAMLHRVSVLKNRMKDAGEPASWGEDPHRDRNAGLARAYQATLRRGNRLDFDDLLIAAVWTLHDQEAARAAAGARYRHVLIDEGQDTNVPQYMLARLIAERHRNLFVVGDPDQAIYGWRGAELRNILGFENDFEGTRRIELDVAYRSTARLLEAAQAMIRRNRKRIAHPLQPGREAGERAAVHTAADARGEADFAVGRAQRRIGSGGTLAVLYRTNAQSRAFERAFQASGIRYRITGGQSFYERPEILDALACLAVGIDPRRDDDAARRFVELPPHRQVGRKATAAIDRQPGRSFWERAQSAVQNGALPAWHTTGLRQRFELAGDAAALTQGLPLENALEAMLEANGYLPALEGSGDGDAGERAENVRELIDDAAVFRNEGVGPDDAAGRKETGRAFLALCHAMANVGDDENAPVTLSTLHRAKGMEFDTVVLAGFTAEQMPSQRAIKDADGSPDAVIEEERRLAYVGMTRARTELVLSTPRTVGSGRRQRAAKPSPFLDEIPDELRTTIEAEPPRPKLPKGASMGPYGPEVRLQAAR